MSWETIDSAPQGIRVQVGHILDPNSMKLESIFKTFGEKIDGKWECTSGFVCWDGFLRWQPTHWYNAEGVDQ